MDVPLKEEEKKEEINLEKEASPKPFSFKASPSPKPFSKFSKFSKSLPEDIPPRPDIPPPPKPDPFLNLLTPSTTYTINLTLNIHLKPD
jgi:hypothetical protein